MIVVAIVRFRIVRCSIPNCICRYFTSKFRHMLILPRCTQTYADFSYANTTQNFAVPGEYVIFIHKIRFTISELRIVINSNVVT